MQGRVADAPVRLHWVIAWRHLRVGDRPPAWAWPAFGLALYLLLVGAGFVLYSVYGLAPEAAIDSFLTVPGLGPIDQLPTPKQSYFGALGVATMLVGGAMLLGAALSLVFTLLAAVITISVMLGCMALVVVLSLMTGLELELRDKILGQRAHIRVSSSDGRPFPDYMPVVDAIAERPGIQGASPYLQGEVMVRSGFQRQGGILLGIDPKLHATVSNLPQILREGDYSYLSDPAKIPESEFAFEMLPLEPLPPEKPDPAIDPGLDAKAGAGQGGATALPKDLPQTLPQTLSQGTGDKEPVPEVKPADDDDDGGWEDPAVEIGKLRERGELPPAKAEPAPAPPKTPSAAIPLIPRSPFPAIPSRQTTVDEFDGWEDPEVEIGKLRAAGKLPPAQQPPQAPASEPDGETGGAEEPAEEPDSKPVIDGIFIGSEKAKELAARTGDQVQLITPIGRLTPAGRIPGQMAVKVAGVFDADHYEYDRWLVYTTLPVAQAFLRAGDRVTGIEVKVDDIDKLAERRKLVEDAVAETGRTDLIVQDWQELNRSLFSAMALEKIAVFVALLCVILVASFGILGSNLMSVLEKSKEIAILKTMGCSDRLIQRIFIAEGLCLGILGGLLGIAAGIGICGLLDRYGLPLGGSLQSFERLPVAVDGFEVLLVGVSSLLIVWLSSLYPARIASRMRPVDALRQAER